jgi:hypothetical protein
MKQGTQDGARFLACGEGEGSDDFRLGVVTTQLVGGLEPFPHPWLCCVCLCLSVCLSLSLSLSARACRCRSRPSCSATATATVCSLSAPRQASSPPHSRPRLSAPLPCPVLLLAAATVPRPRVESRALRVESRESPVACRLSTSAPANFRISNFFTDTTPPASRTLLPC